jgi:amidase
MEGQETIPSVLGPMSASVNGIRLFMRAVLDARPWTRDPVTLRKPWDEDAYRLVEHGNHNRMCFAIMWHDGTTMPHPPIRRALNIAKQALLSAGHEGDFYSI